MSMLIYLIPVALFLGGTALLGFLWALRSGQYDDLDGAAERILLDDGDDTAGTAAPRHAGKAGSGRRSQR